MRRIAAIILVLSMVRTMGHAQSSGQWGVCEFDSEKSLKDYVPSGPWDCKIAYLISTHKRYVWTGGEWTNSPDGDGSTGKNMYTIDGRLTSPRYIGLGNMKLTFDGSDDNDMVFFPKNTGRPVVELYDRNGSIGGIGGDNYFAAGLMVGRPNRTGLYIDKDEITVNNQGSPEDFTIGAHFGDVKMWYRDNFAIVSIKEERFINVNNAGRITFDKYGKGNITSNTPIKGAAFDNKGNVVEIPVIYATGKVNADGSVAKIYNATITKISTNSKGDYNDTDRRGDYQINFLVPLPSDHYVIQLTLRDCGGQCRRGGKKYDDPAISYYDQTKGGFKVNIGDNDNDDDPRDDFDSEFMFTVIKI